MLLFLGLITPLLMLGSSFAATTADVVFVVDESGSMGGEHTWISGMVADLDSALNAANVTQNTYSLIGFGDANIDPNLYLNAGTAGDFQTATNFLKTNGGTEDGYDGIEYGFSNLTFRSNAALNVVLITDEDRDEWDSNQSYASILQLFTSNNALLNTVVNARFSNNALGIDSDGNGYFADGNGGFTSATGGTPVSGDGSTIEDYVNLALATEGAAWNLNLLRAGGNTAQSFTNAFVDIKVGEIQNQDPPAVPEPSTAMLIGLGFMGWLGFMRKKYSC